MSFVTLEDSTGLFELVLFPEVHARYAAFFSTFGPYRVHGVVRRQWDSCTIELQEAACLSPPAPTHAREGKRA